MSGSVAIYSKFVLQNVRKWHPERLKMVTGSSLGALGTPLRGLGAVLGSPSTVLRARGALLGPLWGHLGGAWEAFGLVFGGSEGPWNYFFESFCRPEKRS